MNNIFNPAYFMNYLFKCFNFQVSHFKLFAIIFLISIKTSAQSFTLNELLKLQKGNYEQFETIVNRKGYQYLRVEDTGVSSDYVFAFNEENGNANRFIRYSVFVRDQTIHISHQTSFLSDYNALKQSIKANGFLFKKSGKIKDALFIIYQKEMREVAFITFRSKNSLGEFSTGYEIAIN